jgi:hypothetical protein
MSTGPSGAGRRVASDCAMGPTGPSATNAVTVPPPDAKCGADFSQWKQLADVSGPDVALYAPGNEEECPRKLIDRVVAAPETARRAAGRVAEARRAAVPISHEGALDSARWSTKVMHHEQPAANGRKTA